MHLTLHNLTKPNVVENGLSPLAGVVASEQTTLSCLHINRTKVAYSGCRQRAGCLHLGNRHKEQKKGLAPGVDVRYARSSATSATPLGSGNSRCSSLRTGSSVLWGQTQDCSGCAALLHAH
jgi:hypothetical protein